MRSLRWSALVGPVLVAALLAGCGDDGDGGDDLSAAEQEHVAAWTENLQDDEEGLSVAEGEAECMAEAIVRGLGTEVFEENDVTLDDIRSGDSPGELVGDDVIAESEAEAVVQDWDGCVDLPEVMAASINSDGLFDESCLVDALDADLVTPILVASITQADSEPSSDVQDQLFDAIGPCSTEEDGGDGGGGEDGGDGDGDRSFVVRLLAEGFAEDGTLTEEQSLCAADHVVDQIGEDRFTDLLTENEDFDALPDDVQQEIVGALFDALEPCDIPLSALDDGTP